MTSHEPETGAGLTDTEREALYGALDRWLISRRDDTFIAHMGPAVERIVAARTTDLRTDRDQAQDHLAYHLRDFAPGADMEATGDLAVDMAAYVGRLKAERDRLAAQVAAVEALLPTWTTATCQTDGAPCSWHRVAAECADELRAALATGAAEGGDGRG